MVERAHAQGMLVISVVGTVRAAQKVVGHGVDVVVAQGYDGGGHTVADYLLCGADRSDNGDDEHSFRVRARDETLCGLPRIAGTRIAGAMIAARRPRSADSIFA